MRDRFGCIVRGDTTRRNIAFAFTADEYGEGAPLILDALQSYQIKGSFFLTGNYVGNEGNGGVIKRLVAEGHYVGPHSDQHLLYCDWSNRDSLLVSKTVFDTDLEANYAKLAEYGITKHDARFFMPPYEWYNARIVEWAAEQGICLVNFTPGLRTAADYTYPEMGDRYVASDSLYGEVLAYAANHASGLNGFVILIHLGTDPRRTDKFYYQLPKLIDALMAKGYSFERIDKLVE